jgi:hypothetical protein
MRFMVAHLVETHVTDEVLAEAAKHRAIERDAWICQMPHCRSRAPLHEHHVKFRSAGGSDELSNLVTLCMPCHAMLHAGHVVILQPVPRPGADEDADSPASELTFLLGTRRERYVGERRVGLHVVA